MQPSADLDSSKIINTPHITHGHVVSISPVSPAKGLFASPFWKSSRSPLDDEDSFEAVVYNSLTVDPESKLTILFDRTAKGCSCQ